MALRYKVIFVIDELDKMLPKDVLWIIESLKALFNNGSAKFVLITNQDFFDSVANGKSEDIKSKFGEDKIATARQDRGKEYTLFSQRIFIQRPQFKEIREYIEKIVEGSKAEVFNSKEKLKDFNTFKNYACYVSKTD